VGPVKVAVAYDVGAPVVVDDLPTPAIGPRDVLVRVAASGICHTDLTVIAGRSRIPLPVVPGHEACGTVEAVGAEVRRVRVGDRVVASVSPACGACWWCRNGMSNHCERGPEVHRTPRYQLADGRTATAVCGCGSFAEAMVVDEASVIAAHTDLPDEQLALLGCGVTTGLGAALFTAGVEPGSSVAVIGCGGVGQSVIQGARIAGAARIVAIDLSAGRREMALALGATDVVDPVVSDPVAQVQALTSGRGVDHSFEVVGAPDLMAQAFAMARLEGTVTLVGMPSSDAVLSLPATAAVFSGKRLAGSPVGGAQILRDIPRFIGMAEAGLLRLDALVSTRITLDDVNAGIASVANAEGLRTVIV
jgi:S-(hydroxymethyl)glutathione dehydrogenase/alcohol dehydrogenase